MQTQHHRLNALAFALVATLWLLSCQPAEQKAPPPPTAAPAESIYVIFEGPWAIVPDPKDPNSVLAIAPKTKGHRPLAVVPANSILEAGLYDLAIPGRGGAVMPTFDKGLLRVNVEPQSVQRALDTRLERYAIRMPKPDAYLAETRYLSRVGPKYPPDASTEQDYATAVSLRYAVTSKTGFSLAGTQDAGPAFKPLLLDLNTPNVRFTIDPAEIQVHEECDTHSRAAFHDLVRLLGLTLYVDFPENPSDCHKKDPQLAHSEKAQALHGLPVKWPASLLPADDLAAPQTAGISGGSYAAYIDSAARTILHGLEAIYFFHSDGGGCKAPVIVGGS